MKGNELNQSVEIRKMLKGCNSVKVCEELDAKFNKNTNFQFNQNDIANKTFVNNSNDHENLFTDFINSRNLNNNTNLKKNSSINYTTKLKMSPQKKTLISKENLSKNKSFNIQNEFLKKNNFTLKNNKSINHIVRNVEARSNNISPICSSFAKKQILNVKTAKINNLVGRNEIFETEKDSNHKK